MCAILGGLAGGIIGGLLQAKWPRLLPPRDIQIACADPDGISAGMKIRVGGDIVRIAQVNYETSTLTVTPIRNWRIDWIFGRQS